jgi:hypothetical protein
MSYNLVQTTHLPHSLFCLPFSGNLNRFYRFLFSCY